MTCLLDLLIKLQNVPVQQAEVFTIIQYGVWSALAMELQYCEYIIAEYSWLN